MGIYNPSMHILAIYCPVFSLGKFKTGEDTLFFSSAGSVCPEPFRLQCFFSFTPQGLFDRPPYFYLRLLGSKTEI